MIRKNLAERRGFSVSSDTAPCRMTWWTRYASVRGRVPERLRSCHRRSRCNKKTPSLLPQEDNFTSEQRERLNKQDGTVLLWRAASFFLPFRGIKFLPFYFRFNRKYVDYKQVASGLVIVFYCDWKNIVLRGIGLVLCGYSTKLANNGKWDFWA